MKPTIGLDMDEAARLPLRENEMRALQGWAADPKAAPVAPETAAKMFRLFLQGYSCKEIQQQESFRGFTHGAIVHARVVGRWDDAASELRDRLKRSTLDQAFHAMQETQRVAVDVLACANRRLGDKARAFLAGETDELPLPVGGISQYRALVDLVAQMAGEKSAIPPEQPSKPEVVEAEQESDRDVLKGWANKARGSIKAPPAEA